MAKNFKKKRLFTVAALTVLLALAMLVFASCETGKTYTLTFETGNGSAVSPIKAKAGDKIQLPDEPTLDVGGFFRREGSTTRNHACGKQDLLR